MLRDWSYHISRFDHLKFTLRKRKELLGQNTQCTEHCFSSVSSCPWSGWRWHIYFQQLTSAPPKSYQFWSVHPNYGCIRNKKLAFCFDNTLNSSLDHIIAFWIQISPYVNFHCLYHHLYANIRVIFIVH